VVLARAGLITTVTQLYTLAVLLALVLGVIQSILRLLLAIEAPSGHRAATFGLVQVGTELTGFAASFGFSLACASSGSPRAGFGLLLLQLLVGWWLLHRASNRATATT